MFSKLWEFVYLRKGGTYRFIKIKSAPIMFGYYTKNWTYWIGARFDNSGYWTLGIQGIISHNQRMVFLGIGPFSLGINFLRNLRDENV